MFAGGELKIGQRGKRFDVFPRLAVTAVIPAGRWDRQEPQGYEPWQADH
jgi:hypothetical protein